MGDLLFNTTYPPNLKLGSLQVDKVFCGTTQVWPRSSGVTGGRGILYNGYAAKKNIARPGWHLPTDAEWTALTDFLGGLSVAGGKMKEIGTARWNAPNTGADNSSGFTGRPGGSRDYTGAFSSIATFANFWSITVYGSNGSYVRRLTSSSAAAVAANNGWAYGLSIRLIKNDSSLASYTDFEGNVYQTIKIGNQVWMAENLKTQYYMDGTMIPNIMGNSSWASDIDGAMCYYNNDLGYL